MKFNKGFNSGYDDLIDYLYGTQMTLHFMTKEHVEDIMNRQEREDLDVELLVDTDDRPDFLQLRSLERTIDNFEKGEYFCNSPLSAVQEIEDFEFWANREIPVWQ